jgi:hypothetical protein
MGLTNKEKMPLELRIVPLELEKTPIQKVAHVNQLPTTSTRGKCTSEALEETMEAVEQGICSLWATSSLVENPPFCNYILTIKHN